jgi:hypothetical protein
MGLSQRQGDFRLTTTSASDTWIMTSKNLVGTEILFEFFEIIEQIHIIFDKNISKKKHRVDRCSLFYWQHFLHYYIHSIISVFFRFWPILQSQYKSHHEQSSNHLKN